MKDEFIGKKVKVEYVQKLGWRQPINFALDKRSYHVARVLSKWEEHTLGKPWWSRKHRVWYLIELDDGKCYHLYWNRGARGEGKDWILAKRVAK